MLAYDLVLSFKVCPTVCLNLRYLFHVERRLDQKFHGVRLFPEVDLRGFGVAVILKGELVQNVVESRGSQA